MDVVEFLSQTLAGLTISLRELLIAVILATAIYLLETLVFSKRRRKNRLAAERVEPVVASAGASPVASAGASPEVLAGLRAEIGILKSRVEALEKRLTAEEETREEETVLSPYAQATQLARQGLSATELCARCGISRGEAELIVALHQRVE